MLLDRRPNRQQRRRRMVAVAVGGVGLIVLGAMLQHRLFGGQEKTERAYIAPGGAIRNQLPATYTVAKKPEPAQDVAGLLNELYELCVARSGKAFAARDMETAMGCAAGDADEATIRKAIATIKGAKK